jgi:hypothetical protein
MDKLKEKQEPHLSLQQQQQWNKWYEDVKAAEQLAQSSSVTFSPLILTRFAGTKYQVPDVELCKSQTLKLIEGAQLSTNALKALEAEDILSAWKPFFEPGLEKANEDPVQESPLDSNRRNMKRPYAMMQTVEDIIQAAAPPPEQQVQEEPNRMQMSEVYVGAYKKQRRISTDFFANLSTKDMILFLRPLQQRSREQPFWLAQVKEWNPQSGEAVLHWYGQYNESDGWEVSRWGEAMYTLTKEVYDALEETEKEKGPYKRKNIGKAVIDSIENLILDPEVVFMFGFELTAGQRFSGTTIARIRQRIRQEGVLFSKQ